MEVGYDRKMVFLYISGSVSSFRLIINKFNVSQISKPVGSVKDQADDHNASEGRFKRNALPSETSEITFLAGVI